MCSWFGCIQSGGAAPLHDRRRLAVVVRVRVRADHEPHELEVQVRPGRARARAGASSRARGGPCPRARRRRPRRSRRRSRAGPRATAAAAVAATVRAAPGRRGPVRVAVRTQGSSQGSIRTPGLRMPAGSTADFAARSAAANGSGRWRSYHGRWSRPTAWWWVIVPPAGDDRLGGRQLHLVPLRELLAAASRREHREVGRRAVGVDVREPAGHDVPGRRSASRARFSHAVRPGTRSGPT